MKMPISWLRDFVDIRIKAEELSAILTMAGLEVGGIETIGDWDNCFVGAVVEVKPHPDADRLVLCTVDIGNEIKKIVCGAPNVQLGQKIAFASPGAKLTDPYTNKVITLKPAKIRGVVSEGMICSEAELGLGDEHDGILILPMEAPVGVNLSDYLGDQLLDLEPTPNRPDWLSVIGVAYEIAALTGEHIHEPKIYYTESDDPITDHLSVDVLATDLCHRYTSSLIRGLTVSSSPFWMRYRLFMAGIRPINNVVDVTNYVMLEYGQPLHAFDYGALPNHKVIVRRAKKGEILKTLDGEDRFLTCSQLVIADDSSPKGLAGIMGGLDSEITVDTIDVFLEAASFESSNNRRTAQKYRLKTEASLRFEKGIRTGLPLIALRRATQMIQQIAGGTISKGVIDSNQTDDPTSIVMLSAERLYKILGVKIPIKKASKALTALGFNCSWSKSSHLAVEVPYWRSDIHIEDDLIEEIARILGYDVIPTTMLSTPVPPYLPQPLRDFKERVRDLMVIHGLQETISYSAVNLDVLKLVGDTERAFSLVRIANPMSVDFEYLRPSLRASSLRTLAHNLRYLRESIAIFEIGKVYQGSKNDLPDERDFAASVLHGPRTQEGWLSSIQNFDFFDAKGIVEGLLDHLGGVGEFHPCNDSYFHPTRAASIYVNGTIVGKIGEIHPLIQKAFEIDNPPPVYFELDLKELCDAIEDKVSLRMISRYPASIRDIAILVDKDVPFSEIQSAIQQNPLVEKAVFFDAYEGEGIPPNKSSLGYRLYFQAYNKTLSARDVNEAVKKVVQTLVESFGVSLRGEG